MTNSIKLTGLWEKKDKKGKSYFTGSLNGSARLVIFPNGFKEKDTEPDYIAYIVPVTQEGRANDSRETRQNSSKQSREELAF